MFYHSHLQATYRVKFLTQPTPPRKFQHFFSNFDLITLCMQSLMLVPIGQIKRPLRRRRVQSNKIAPKLPTILHHHHHLRHHQRSSSSLHRSITGTVFFPRRKLGPIQQLRPLCWAALGRPHETPPGHIWLFTPHYIILRRAASSHRPRRDRDENWPHVSRALRSFVLVAHYDCETINNDKLNSVHSLQQRVQRAQQILAADEGFLPLIPRQEQHNRIALCAETICQCW